ncbi:MULTISPECIES: SDR family NAD(P)-dependent oxidoreductase [Rhodococcus]|uniref:SDR family NAD(P)-dependent oxidoreductase n=2 Tax=Nocardiaceae TaxID=85025 RepID=A0ABU4C0S6_RHOGO|nr:MULTISPECIES: SDR family NAD(P)-dependent oxidoreductase [Rhodococcus]MCE4265981.1 SDR family oxidoreductase [Rhodococcus globerulus]MDV6270106.1 SDR family NAD(P)-dependent oxidoreductase [Rhodococcus globerulus]RZL21884.1 MAG: SDR family oxidoreductase [Rhodococcus sp. (in: high G+C Gram-positive bacteria)]
MKLLNRVAVVTGAGQGLGRAIALAMAEEGANLVLCDVQGDKLAEVSAEIEGLGRESLPVRCDVSSKSEVAEMFTAAAERFGTVHILVNNAAIVPTSPADEIRRNKHYEYVTTPVPRRAVGITSSLDDDDWLRWWDVNVHGLFYCTREALKYMEPQQYGRIVNISSVAGISTASMHSPGYSASKAAVANLTKTVALDVAGANIFVNAIACGGVLTPPFEAYLEHATDEEKQNLYQMIPVGRLGKPEEYASLALYLAGENHYLVGQVISANGGVVI